MALKRASSGLSRPLAGLAIPHVGDSIADLLAKEFGDVDA
jgi:NAD-dependent DNA ligase